MAVDKARIEKNVSKLRRLLKKRSKLDTPKGVHDLRTRTRRLEAMLPAVGLAARGNERKLLRRLREVRKKAGKVRDMDVLTAHILELNADDESDCKVRLLEYLGEERYRLGKKLNRAVKANAKSARPRLKRLARELRSIGDGQGTDSSAGRTGGSPRVNAAASALELGSRLAEPKVLNRGNLHPYRLKVKELRYVLKSAEGATDQRFVHALGECKDAIGEWHDWAELLAIASDVLDHGTKCKLMAEIRKRSRERFETALSTANSMRKEFVVADSSHRRRRLRQKRGTGRPALAAASALAR